jgi:glycosyltransferase involved in cell wall biosynthesis
MKWPLTVDVMDSDKVVMIISQFYPLLGGAEVQAQRLASALRARGVDIFILTGRIKNRPAYEIIDGIPVYRSIRTVNVPLLFGFLYVVSVGVFLYRKRNTYEIIHCNILQELQTLVSIIIKLMFNKKVVAKMSSSGITSDLKIMKQTLAGRLTLRLLNKADRIISLCSVATSELLGEGIPPDRLEQISNGVDTGRFTVRARHPHPGQKMITCIGRLDGFKGVDHLLEAFRQVIAGGADARLTIIGTGPDEEKLKRLVAALALEDKVLFKGRCENVLQELSETDFFVLPSLSEGMSNVLLEAMSCGLPVIATAVGGAIDMIRNGINGILVPPGDRAALSRALIDLLADEPAARSLGREARKTVEERYALSHTADCYRRLYRELTAPPPALQ